MTTHQMTPKYRTSRGITRPYVWKSYMKPSPGENPLKWTEEELKPLFLYPGHLKIEDWNLEMIRRKNFVVLKDAKDYERDKWLPKSLMMISFVMKQEMVSLMELSPWLGMPKYYLRDLTRRDPGWRRLCLYWRAKNLGAKQLRARASVMSGAESILFRMRPHWTSSCQTEVDDVNPYEHPIHVAWKPRYYSRNC